ncbi:MAG TPA: amidase [Xanthobacteraceae bacterium]|jgi:amidase|nr:amidase [Xanthobacteraceae bacterium]
MFQKPSVADLRQAAQKLGMNPSDEYLLAVEQIIAPLANAYATLDETPDELPAVKYPRGPVHRPQGGENPHGAWYVKTSIKGRPGGKLAGRRVVLKDNVCLAGVPMMIGANLLEGYVPEVDATVVERILGAGGEIVGKAVCEYYCVSGGSHTSESGPVHNPRKRGYSAGGSSSGSAALVAAGDVDMAIGGDQAGSIRIPASHCGIVGLKPTYGLVPYTGIAPLEITLDTCGPMTANVRDNALLLEVIAGPDGIDSRQRGVQPGRYTDAVDGGVKSLRVGVMKEGFGHPNSEPDVDAHVSDAAQRLAKLGAVVEQVSVPMHALGFPVWSAIRGDAACVTLLEMNGAGIAHEGLYVTSLLDHAMGWRGRADEFADTLKIASIFSAYTLDRYGGHYYAKAQNLRRRVRAAYDAALMAHDLLLMPTVPMKATPIPGKGATPQEITRRSWEPTRNTCPFNVTGHPAISLPCGMEDGRPVGLMLVGRHYAEETIYRAAAAFERSGDWTTF